MVTVTVFASAPYWNLFSISGRQAVSVKSILGHFWKNWNDQMRPIQIQVIRCTEFSSSSIMVNHALWGGPKILSLARRRSWLSAFSFGLWMNVLRTIYLPWRNWSSVLASTQPESAVNAYTLLVCIHTCTYAYKEAVQKGFKNIHLIMWKVRILGPQ